MTTDSADQQDVMVENVEVQVVKRNGVFNGMLYHISRFWPIRIMIRAYRSVWYMFGFAPKNHPEVCRETVATPARPSLSGLKRLRRVTRIILAILPRRLQSAMGYPVPTSVGCSLSPEMRISPTKPCGKGNKRKQDEVDDDDLELPTWVDALSQEMSGNEGSEEDPDYQPTAVETESEEYCSDNDTDKENDLERNEQGMLVIVEVAVPPATSP